MFVCVRIRSVNKAAWQAHTQPSVESSEMPPSPTIDCKCDYGCYRRGWTNGSPALSLRDAYGQHKDNLFHRLGMRSRLMEYSAGRVVSLWYWGMSVKCDGHLKRLSLTERRWILTDSEMKLFTGVNSLSIRRNLLAAVAAPVQTKMKRTRDKIATCFIFHWRRWYCSRQRLLYVVVWGPMNGGMISG